MLIETTDLPMADVAFAAGFASIRQFNDTVREVFATTPDRPAATTPPAAAGGAPGWLTLRLAARAPYDAAEVLLFLGAHAVPGLEEWDGTTFSRVLDLPHGPAVVAALPRRRTAAPPSPRGCGWPSCATSAPPSPAAAGCSTWTPTRPPSTTSSAPTPPSPRWSRPRPGRRVPASPDADELAVRAVLGQQVSVAGARTLTARVRDGGRHAARRAGRHADPRLSRARPPSPTPTSPPSA